MRISFTYMALGFGGRFGSDKLLIPFKGKELYRRGLDYIYQTVEELEKKGHQTGVLAVSRYETILERVESRGLLAVPNRSSGEGITAPPRLGTSLTSPETEALLFLVADQPYMSTPTLKKFIHGFRLSGKGVGYMYYQGRQRDPAVLNGFYRRELMALRGDREGSVIIKVHPGDVRTTEVPEEEFKGIGRTENLGAIQTLPAAFSRYI